ncbi:MAG: HD domain-containing protein [Candidatus Moranbacteria bacterium]|nr:HD domain-containing protein [Candidatus Moranbacteria bacterium]
MKLDKIIEEKIKEEVLKKLQNGKPNWDIPHTLNAVEWMRCLIEGEGGNERILIPAIYFHDTGYPELDENYNYDDLIESKKMHAIKGAEFTKNVLSQINYFSKEEVEEIVYLVKKHDEHDNLETHNRRLIFEADGLSMIDWEHVKPNFDQKNRTEFLNKYFISERGLDRWHTITGKKYLKILFKKAKEYNINNP